SLGKRFTSSTQAVADAIKAADPVALAHAVAAGAPSVEGPSLGAVPLSAAGVIVTPTPAEGWGGAPAAGETGARELKGTPALRAEGWAREVIRLIQEARKNDGLDVTDRIVLRWSAADDDLAAALAEHNELIAGEVLAVSFGPGEGPGDGTGAWHEHSDAD